MEDELLRQVNEIFPNKVYLTVKDIMTLLECSDTVIYNWIKRSDAKKRPPRIFVGTEIRFEKLKFLRWLEREQGST
ncbi:MAG: helix-turn-helix domain-containing protein [Bdellovibrionota bacterium]